MERWDWTRHLWPEYGNLALVAGGDALLRLRDALSVRAGDAVPAGRDRVELMNYSAEVQQTLSIVAAIADRVAGAGQTGTEIVTTALHLGADAIAGLAAYQGARAALATLAERQQV